MNQRFWLPVCCTSSTALMAWQCGQGGGPSDGARTATMEASPSQPGCACRSLSSAATFHSCWRVVTNRRHFNKCSHALTVLIAWNIGMIANAFVNVGEPFLATDSFSAGSFGLGLMMASAGVGLALGAYLAGSWIEERGLANVYGVSLGLMGVGVWLHLTERHEHEHVHEEMDHDHPHVHDEHHQHAHGPNEPPGVLCRYHQRRTEQPPSPRACRAVALERRREGRAERGPGSTSIEFD